MQTTCPECRTTFRVSQDHLGARRGLVRCGTCNAVFNAYDTLLPELEAPPAADAAASMDNLVESAVAEPIPAIDADLGAIERTPAAVLAEVEADVAVAANEVTIVVPVASQATQLQESEPDILLQPLPIQEAKHPRAWKALFNVSLTTMLVSLLLLQAAYFLRAELAAALPDTRSALEWLCQPLNCVVPLPRQLAQGAIAASSLEHDPEQKSRVRLTFLLTNRTGQTQAWPHITLTLSDMREAPVGRQIFRPEVYLPKGVKISAGMAAGAEREVRLDLDIGNLVASGYALSLSYP